MTVSELSLRFPSRNQVEVLFDGADSGPLEFKSPVTEKDRSDIRWYVETYGAAWSDEPDDVEARRIESRLAELGKELFSAVFSSMKAVQPFVDFRNRKAERRVLTINSQEASILALPWELLHDPAGEFLFRERPHISIRRRIAGATGGRAPFAIKAKENLHLLFVVSRPRDAGFLDPRADARAVLGALQEHAPGRVTWEFLYPATLDALVERLDDETRPAVDILHFDGHGVFTSVSEDEAKRDSARYGPSVHSEIQRELEQRREGDPAKPVGIGFLVFERADGTAQLVSAADLAENLFRSRVGLIVLSACQTAALDGEGDPMASVAGRLTATGIPAILAMTHSVLAVTTRMLFGKFYGSLARGRGLATALDDARAFLDLPHKRGKYEVQRGNGRKMLELRDWFVPALFHGGEDSPMLTKQDANPSLAHRASEYHNLRPVHEAGFFGRRRELWEVERWFAGGTRRISITGFGGQGKTELALEAGRWLLRAGMFRRAVFVDYAAVQSEDALGVAVSTIAAVVEETLIDANAVTDALARQPTLVILDNLEKVAAEPLAELLTAAAAWSEAGGSRVLMTTRLPETGHPDYAVEGTRKHRRIALTGLGSAAYPDDALEWFRQLSLLPSAEPPQVPPPKREELIALFDRVQFHPLSISVLVPQLRTRTAKELQARLEQRLGAEAGSPVAEEGTPPELVASLELSLERLSEAERHAARRLGVFQGGAFEDDLLAITELGKSDDRQQLQAMLEELKSGDPRAVLRIMGMDLPDGVDIPAELLAELTDNRDQIIQQLRAELADLPAQEPEDVWPGLRRSLEAAALVQAESIPGVGPPFLRFHPTLAPMLWAGLDAAERDALRLAHRRQYYGLAGYLYHNDSKAPFQVRAIARRELPNLLHAVRQALDAGDPDAVDFVASVNRFLSYFGMTRAAASLTCRAEQAGGEKGSWAWYLAQSGRGEQLLAAGRAQEAAEIFTDILRTLGDEPSYNLALTFDRLGRCYMAGGRPALAEATYRQGIAVTERLEQSDHVKRQCSVLHTDLANVLMIQGKYVQAREQYELASKIDKELGDLCSRGVIVGQLGTLAMLEGDLAEAVDRHIEALKLFQHLGEPGMEAVAQHQLGMAFEEAKQWERAEHHYRESARLREQLGDLAGAATTWNQLAIVSARAGKPEAAERWFRKAIEGGRQTGDALGLARRLGNLAALLRMQPARLAEARQMAEEALAIKKTLDPGAAEIWTTYNILAKIAESESHPQEAAEYRRLAREAKRKSARTTS